MTLNVEVENKKLRRSLEPKKSLPDLEVRMLGFVLKLKRCQRAQRPLHPLQDIPFMTVLNIEPHVDVRVRIYPLLSVRTFQPAGKHEWMPEERFAYSANDVFPAWEHSQEYSNRLAKIPKRVVRIASCRKGYAWSCNKMHIRVPDMPLC